MPNSPEMNPTAVIEPYLARFLLGEKKEWSEMVVDASREMALAALSLPAELQRFMDRALRGEIQYVHQDAGASLDPWWSIGRILDEGLVINGLRDARRREEKIDRMLAAVGLDASFKPRYVHELSGGQLRRVVLARILVLEPRIVILDEPTSGLDLSVQATVLNLLAELKSRLGLTYLFISHDLSVVARMCDRVAIMYLGRIVELAPAGAIFTAPKHPYTRALLAAAPRLDRDREIGGGIIEGEPPSPRNLPSGCAFRTRCPYAATPCAEVVPELSPAGAAHEVACLRWREIEADAPPARAASEVPA